MYGTGSHMNPFLQGAHNQNVVFLCFLSVYLARLPPDLAEDEEQAAVADVKVAEMEEEEGGVEIETGTAEAKEVAEARFYQGLWQGPGHIQSLGTARGQRPAPCPYRGSL